ncbi:unnamed protein product [Hermetia illucens]|uniref:Cytochrome P450 n=1 Tax=Hermetia illucens TaxID=343691 RepID=A0A7R8YR10_HERIL|nr:unnamed protein product [Hermetia illucens]
MGLVVILCSVLVTLLTFIYVIFKIQYRYWNKRGIACLKPVFPFGSLYQNGKRCHIMDAIEASYRKYAWKEPVVGGYYFNQTFLLILDLDLVHKVLVRDFSKFPDRGLFYNEKDDPLSANLLTLSGYKWKALRLKLTPTFTSTKMRFMYPTMLGVMDQFDQTLRELLKTQTEIEIRELLARFTTDVIGSCAFGIECNSFKHPNTEFRRTGRTAFEKTRYGLIGRAFVRQFPDLSRKLGLKIIPDDVNDFFMRAVRETVEFREKNNVRRNDFMDILIQLKNGNNITEETKNGSTKLTFEELAGQAFIFFLAGFETSSTNMTYTLYELAMNTEIQERARREINEVLRKHGGQLTYDAMKEMTYIDRINKVSMLTTVYVVFQIQFRHWAKRKVPCLEPTFPSGSLRQNGKQLHLMDVFNEVYRKFKGKQPVGGMYYYNQPILVLIDPDLVHNILVKDFSKFSDRGMFFNQRDDPLSANLLTLEVHEWKPLRSKLTPTFTSAKMRLMYPTILQIMDEFHKALRKLLKTQSEVEIKDLLARFTTDVIGTCAFGIECNSLKDPDTEFRRTGRTAFEKTRYGLIGRAFVRQFPDLSRKLGLKIIPDDVNDFFMRAVRETVEFREKNNVRRNDFMDILIQMKNGSNITEETKNGSTKLTFEELAGQAFIFFLAGFETSSTNMTYTLYELAMNTEIQERARHEINDVLEKHGGEFTYDAMKEMAYIDHINKESIRKYPPATVLPRKCLCDYEIPNSDIVIEKGTNVIISTFSIHRDPNIWPDPEVFNPERFTPEEMQGRHPVAFLGFGDGPRNCIGAKFGQMQSRIGIVSLLKNYRFTPCSKTPKVMEFARTIPILTPKGGLWLKVEPIE